MNVKESAGRGPLLQDIDKPLTTCSNRPNGGFLLTSPSTTGGIISHTIFTSLVDIIRKAAAISGAQLHRGGAKHLDNCSMVPYAASLTMAELNKGSTYLTCKKNKN